MVIYFENALSRDDVFEFDYEAVAKKVCEAVLENQNCPFDCEIDIMLTDNETVRSINKETRNIDRETDVLSFPNLFFEAPAEFDIAESEICDFVNPENDMVVLGEIVLSYDRILSQAEEFGHSVKREYAFLIAHSMLHLCGYDHMEPDEASVMESLQKEILDGIGITRGIIE